MAARLALASSSSLRTRLPLISNPSAQALVSFHTCSTRTARINQFRISANLAGGDGELKKGKKFITKEQEPEQYWQTAGERKGENPMKTPIPYIIIFGMSTPFIILAIAFANGWIKMPR
ncbi:hypothetical protein Drorol1_Dr00019471 [Drosera rotundifolia]